MSDNREIARAHSPNYLEARRLMPAALTFGAPDGTELEKLRRAVESALDAATERGRMQGWSADAATVERVAIRLSMMDDDERPLPSAWAGKMADYYRMLARAAIAAIPAPPAPEGE